MSGIAVDHLGGAPRRSSRAALSVSRARPCIAGRLPDEVDVVRIVEAAVDRARLAVLKYARSACTAAVLA
jgi:hypothetical protein